MPPSDALLTVADELYALQPSAFVTTRNERAADAKNDGDTELAARIRRLAKPTASAWAVNMLVRHRADEMNELFELGSALRAAQEKLDRDELKRLGAERHDIVARLTETARSLAAELDQKISDTAAREAHQTLQAAVVDAGAELAVRTGRLLEPLAATGLEPVDASDAVGAPPPELAAQEGSPSASAKRSAPRAVSQKKRGTKKNTDIQSREQKTARKSTNHNTAAEREGRETAEFDRARARRDARNAEREASEAQAAVDEIDERLDELDREHTDLTDELATLTERLREVRNTVMRLERDIRRRQRDRERAARALTSAERAAEQARARVEELL
ncbi:hypothetical protein GCM10027416_07890 [Okibacterium endophyticum]